MMLKTDRHDVNRARNAEADHDRQRRFRTISRRAQGVETEDADAGDGADAFRAFL